MLTISPLSDVHYNATLIISRCSDIFGLVSKGFDSIRWLHVSDCGWCCWGPAGLHEYKWSRDTEAHEWRGPGQPTTLDLGESQKDSGIVAYLYVVLALRVSLLSRHSMWKKRQTNTRVAASTTMPTPSQPLASHRGSNPRRSISSLKSTTTQRRPGPCWSCLRWSTHGPPTPFSKAHAGPASHGRCLQPHLLYRFCCLGHPGGLEMDRVYPHESRLRNEHADHVVGSRDLQWW